MEVLEQIKIYQGNHTFGCNLPLLFIDWHRSRTFNIAAISILDFNLYREGLFEYKNRVDWLGLRTHTNFYDMLKGEYCGRGFQGEGGDTDTEVYILGCLIIPCCCLHNMSIEDCLTLGSLIHTNYKETYHRTKKIYNCIQTIKEAECIAK